jgi:hypothetical protein
MDLMSLNNYNFVLLILILGFLLFAYFKPFEAFSEHLTVINPNDVQIPRPPSDYQQIPISAFNTTDFSPVFYNKNRKRVNMKKFNLNNTYYDNLNNIIDRRNIFRYNNRFYYRRLFNNSTRYCNNCGDLSPQTCKNCVNCGTCYDNYGQAECVAGDKKGPYFRADCSAWSHGKNNLNIVDQPNFYLNTPYYYNPYLYNPYYDVNNKPIQNRDTAWEQNPYSSRWNYRPIPNTPVASAFDKVKDTQVA